MANFNQSRKGSGKKYIVKKLVYETVDFFAGEDDYVKKIFMG